MEMGVGMMIYFDRRGEGRMLRQDKKRVGKVCVH